MRPVRSIITALLVVSLRFYAAEVRSATSKEVESGVVELSLVESVETHRRREDITAICRSDYSVKGCTDFPVERLECSCKLRGAQWMIDTRARVRAVVHLSEDYTSGTLMHERMHLADLEEHLREHLEGIAAKPWESKTACRTYARVLSDTPHLRIVMNKIRLESNVRYGCAKRRASSE